MRKNEPHLSGKIPDTGSLRGDVVALLERMSKNLSQLSREIFLGVLADSINDPKIADFIFSQAITSGRTVMTTILKQAQKEVK